MISHVQHNLTEPTARGFDRAAVYALFVLAAVLLFLALMTNPVLP